MLTLYNEWIIKQVCSDLRNTKARVETKDKIAINIDLYNIKKFLFCYAKLRSIEIYSRRTLMEVSLYHKFNFGELQTTKLCHCIGLLFKVRLKKNEL